MKVGKYELGKTIGRGAFSKVKLAIHSETQKEFVLKIIDKRGDGSKTVQEITADLKMEISIMKVLNHENIVRMFEVMESSKHFYIVLESVRGGDLCDHIMDAGKLPEEKGRKYLWGLTEGLIACHAAGVAHRDIKPENCLISTEGILKVADFGLSRMHPRGRGDIHDSSEMATDSVGTLSYAAPEVLDGHYNAFKADLWSVGVVVFVMTTGKFPFGSKGYTDAQIQADIRKAKINKFPSHLSDECKDIILKLIIVDPHKRLPLDGILEHPWLASEYACSPRAAAAAVAQGKPAPRRRPQAIDVDQVKAEAQAIVEAGGAVDDGIQSPTWADSPHAGAQRRFQPGLFSPTAKDSPKGAGGHGGGGGGVADLSGLKGMLDKEAREIGAR
eukprot:TRINITY_DN60_c0_g1_i4.p1 TRINITY_DN60_c0_g1~~TRINITY_DN60_c0_g1_i4.p1  ORF type:complete len:387 (+),score=150.14 TRINITY_DN60_c0_g1_i4:112-1272(+)